MNEMVSSVLLLMGLAILILNWPVSRSVVLPAGHKVTVRESLLNPSITLTVKDPDRVKHRSVFPTNTMNRPKLIKEMDVETVAQLAFKVTGDPSCLFTTVPKLAPGKAIVVTGNSLMKKALAAELITRGGAKPKLIKAGVNDIKQCEAGRQDTVIIASFVPSVESSQAIKEWLAKDDCPALIIIMLGMHTTFDFDGEAMAV